MHSDQTILRLHRYEAVSTASFSEWLMTVAPPTRFAYFLNERDWRVSRSLTLRCAAAIKTPLSLLAWCIQTRMQCTVLWRTAVVPQREVW